MPVDNIDSEYILEKRYMAISMWLSLIFLVIKWTTYSLTLSSAVFSDALESIVHIIAVAFAGYSLSVSIRPPDDDHHFGHDKIAFFSTGVEGVLVALAGLASVGVALSKFYSGAPLENLGTGALLTIFVGLLSGSLGFFLKSQGKKIHSIILKSNGVHLLADFWTSVGLSIGLIAVKLTGWQLLDPLIAASFGLFVFFSGAKFLRAAIRGLTDVTHPEYEARAREALVGFCQERGLEFERLRLRETPRKIHVDFHLHFFNENLSLKEAHALGTEAERAVARALQRESFILCHIEPAHAQDSEQGLYCRL